MHWLLIGYMFLFIDRPFELYPVLEEIRLERLYVLLTFVAVAAFAPKRWLSNPQHLAYLGFATAVAFCWAASPWADAGEGVVENYFKILVFYTLLVVVVHDERTLRQVLLGFLVVMALYMTHSLKEYVGGRYTYRMGTVRLMGVDTTLGDPNSFGGSILFALPFVVPFWRDRPTRTMKAFLAGYVALSGTCILLTGSRSSLVGMLVAAMVLVMRSRRRWLWLSLAAPLTPLLFLALPDDLQSRFETIVNSEAGPANAQESGFSRVEGFLLGLDLWAENPLTGCGPGAWKPATHRDLESHNLYGQVLGEMGSVGVLAFAGILVAFAVNLRRVRRLYRRHPEWGDDFLREVTRAVGLAVLLMLLEGNFGHNLFRHNWLWFGGFLIIAHHCVRRRLRGAAPAAVSVHFGWRYLSQSAGVPGRSTPGMCP